MCLVERDKTGQIFRMLFFFAGLASRRDVVLELEIQCGAFVGPDLSWYVQIRRVHDRGAQRTQLATVAS